MILTCRSDKQGHAKNEGLKKYITDVYTRPALKFLQGNPWTPVADLIFGPDDIYTSKFFNEDVRQRGFERLAALEKLWGELRVDILKAQAQYAPNRKPWGCRFDAK